MHKKIPFSKIDFKIAKAFAKILLGLDAKKSTNDKLKQKSVKKKMVFKRKRHY